MRAKSPEILTALALGCGVAFGQTPAATSEATAYVSVQVLPCIAVSSPETVIISLKDAPADSPIAAQVHFSVRANTPQVEFQVACTDLYRAGDPASPYRIPVAGAGAQITCEDGGPVLGSSGLLPWLPSPLPGLLPLGWAGAVSAAGLFQASHADIFSQDVAIDVAWRVGNLPLPAGEYSGFVQLIGVVHP